eukprot:10847299-Karenia_brevis.AAC.1
MQACSHSRVESPFEGGRRLHAAQASETSFGAKNSCLKFSNVIGRPVSHKEFDDADDVAYDDGDGC